MVSQVITLVRKADQGVYPLIDHDYTRLYHTNLRILAGWLLILTAALLTVLLLVGTSQASISGDQPPSSGDWLVGNVTMDYIMVDVGDVPEVRVGEEITLLGTDGDAEITTLELARLQGAPPYVVTSLLGKRVKRIYKDSSGAELQKGAVRRKETHTRSYDVLVIK